MSSLIFYVTPGTIILAMDTLAVSDQAGTPFLYTTKFYPVPHLNSVICGTGLGGFVTDWFVQANTRMVVSDIEHLDFHTPSTLREIGALATYRDYLAKQTTTIYHFGFSLESSSACAFAYRSEKDFLSERLAIGGIALKPFGDVPEPFELPTDFEKIMLSQRQHQAQKPVEERVYIGGDILVCQMTRELTAIYRAGRFPDRDEMLRAMFANIRRAKARNVSASVADAMEDT